VLGNDYGTDNYTLAITIAVITVGTGKRGGRGERERESVSE
jgi:hypothetical protein